MSTVFVAVSAGYLPATVGATEGEFLTGGSRRSSATIRWVCEGSGDAVEGQVEHPC